MARTISPKNIKILPIEKGVRPDGTPYTRAVIIKSARRSYISRDLPKTTYRDAKLVEPYLKQAVLDEFLIAAPTHGICVDKKSRMVAGLGIKIVSTFDQREARVTVRAWENAEKEKRKDLDKKKYKEAKDKIESFKIEKEKLQNWIDNCTDQSTLIETLKRFWYDYEAYGNGNLEIRRDESDEIAKITHAPSIRIKVGVGGEKFAFYETANTLKPVYFKRYGDPRHLNATTGEWREWQGTPGEDDFKAGQSWGNDEANELLRYVCYSPKDMLYGIPTWYSAMADILGGIESRDFMLKFFSDKAVPLYAVLLEGGSWSQDTINTIQAFFRRELAQNYHATLALEVPTGGKITFEQVSPEPKWWPFILKYRDAVRDIIVSVHGLTPAIVGVIETAHLGGGDGSQQMEMVKTVEIKPRQEVLEWLINGKIVRDGMGVTHAKTKLDEIDVRDETSEVTAVNSLYSTPPRPSITTNEARERLRYPPIDAEWADEILIQDPQFGLLPIGQLSEAVRNQAKAAQIGGQMGGQELQPQQDPYALPSEQAAGTPEDRFGIDSQNPDAEAPDFASLFDGVQKQINQLQAMNKSRLAKTDLRKKILDAISSV